MSGRLVLVSRRFWPLVGGAESVMAQLAAAFNEQGWPTTLLTARWQPDWPAEVVHRGVPVVRLPQPKLRGWGTLRYMRALNRWLRDHADRFDLVYVSMLKHDAYAALGAARQAGFPVALRAEGAGLTGDVHWQLEARGGRLIRNRCEAADALVAPSPAVERELIAAGYPRDRLHAIPNGVVVPPPRDGTAARDEARNSLARSQPALYLPPDARLAVYTGRLHQGKGLAHLVEAWQQVARMRSDAYLWLFGEGPLHAKLVRQIRDAELCGRVVLAGTFDCVDEVLAAADLFVLPSLEENMSMALLEAMAQGLPIVATDIPGNQRLLVDGQHGLLVPPRDSASLAAAIERVWSDPEAAARWGAEARARVEAEFSLARSVAAHLQLFEDLLARGAKKVRS